MNTDQLNAAIVNREGQILALRGEVAKLKNFIAERNGVIGGLMMDSARLIAEADAAARAAPGVPAPICFAYMPGETRRIVIASDEQIDGERVLCIAIDDVAAPAAPARISQQAGGAVPDTMKFLQDLYGYLESTCPQGFADEAFRVAPEAVNAAIAAAKVVKGDDARIGAGHPPQDGRSAVAAPNSALAAPVQADRGDEPSEREAVAACLEDDAAKLDDAGYWPEMTQTMRDAARLLGDIAPLPLSEGLSEPKGWRDFITNIATPRSEPLNSICSYRDNESRRAMMGELRSAAQDLLAATPVAPPVAPSSDIAAMEHAGQQYREPMNNGTYGNWHPWPVEDALVDMLEPGYQVRDVYALPGSTPDAAQGGA